MSDHGNFRVWRPGDFGGDKPRTYGKGRRCACGAVISQYNEEDACALCVGNPERWESHVDQSSEITTKEAAKVSGLDRKQIQRLSDEGKFTTLRRGGRGRSAVFDRGEFEAFLALEQTPRLGAARIAPIEPVDLDAERDHVEEDRLLEALVDQQVETYESEAVSEPEPPHPMEGRRIRLIGYCVGIPHEKGAEGQLSNVVDLGDGKWHSEVLFEGDDHAWVVGSWDEQKGFEFAESDEPLKCCGAKDDPTDDCGGPECEHADRFAELDLDSPLAGGEGPWGYTLPFEVPLPVRIDPEIVALDQVRDALGGLERDAQIRVLQWVSSRFGLDKPPVETVS